MYGKEGFAGRGQDVHHWLFEKGGKSGDGFSWWAKNQMFNLKPMNAMKFKGVTYEGAVIHQAMHGNSTILKLNSAEKVYMRIMTTPTWFKAGVGSAPGHINGLLND